MYFYSIIIFLLSHFIYLLHGHIIDVMNETNIIIDGLMNQSINSSSISLILSLYGTSDIIIHDKLINHEINIETKLEIFHDFKYFCENMCNFKFSAGGGFIHISNEISFVLENIKISKNTLSQDNVNKSEFFLNFENSLIQIKVLKKAYFY